MDLFTYLMSKKGENYLPHKGDLFSYLLGKNNSISLKEANGTILHITALKTKINEFEMTKESSQVTTTGKNLFNEALLSQVSDYNTYNSSTNLWTTSSGSLYARSIFYNVVGTSHNVDPSKVLKVQPNTTYTIKFYDFINTSAYGTTTLHYCTEDGTYISSDDMNQQNCIDGYTFTTPSSCKSLDITRLDNNGYLQFSKIQLEEGSTATPYEPYTGGIPAPNPDYPQEVKTVKGYRNLFDKEHIVKVDHKILNDNGVEINDTGGGYTKMYIPVEPNEYITISGLTDAGTKRIYFFDNNKTFISRTSGFTSVTVITTQIPTNCKYIDIQYVQTGNDFNTYMINIGQNALPYVPYGTNWIYTKITNGTDTKYVTLPLNDNEIAGIGNYKDELIVDKNGHCWLNKKIWKYKLTSSTIQTYQSEYNRLDSIITTPTGKNNSPYGFSNVAEVSDGGVNSIKNNKIIVRKRDAGGIYPYCWFDGVTSLETGRTYLSNNNVYLYYPLDTPQLIDLNYTVNLTLYKGENTITNSEDATMYLKYY